MSKQKRLIDANEIVKVAEHAYGEWNLAMAAAGGSREINRIYKMQELCKAVKAIADAAPTIGAVEVVRCKECIYRPNVSNGQGFLICEASGMEITDRDFCSYGELKGDADDA